MPSTVLRSVLAATDLSPTGEAVLRSAAGLAHASGAALHVIHAFDMDLSAYPEALGVAPTFQGRVTSAEEQLAAQVRAVPADVAVASHEVVIFTAHRAILERAEQVRADVVVLGAHRGAPTAGGRLGSTADHVVRSAACPCLVVREALRLPLLRVVVPLDLSDPARGALDVALGWMEALGRRAAGEVPVAGLDVLHVVPSLFESGALPVSHATIGPRLHQDVERALAARGWTPEVREELVWGDEPADEIVRYARERAADLLVLATHGRGMLKRALIGSVSSAVVQRSSTPVLLVPPSRWSGWAARDAGEASVAASTA